VLRISADQFGLMEATARKQFLLETVSEWFALWEACYGRPSRFSFEQAWLTADYVADELDGLPQRPGSFVDYTFIHLVLTFAEKGATPAQLRGGVAAFCQALPAEEAGYILFESMCAPKSAEQAWA
jgi:hypothetical protein